MPTQPKLVLHICCAPDEAYVVQLLRESHELYCFFSNPNIQPFEEYELRLQEARQVAVRFEVPFSASAYEPHLWNDAVSGLETTPEGGDRCRQCFLLRLRQTARFCKEIGWPAFTSVMSVSPHKNIRMLNETGTRAASEFGVTYEPTDFKKNNGFLKSVHLSRQLNIYRQDYCGCRLSKSESDVRKAVRNRIQSNEKLHGT